MTKYVSAFVLCCSLFYAGACEAAIRVPGVGGVNSGHVSAAKDLTTAATVSDQELKDLSRQMRAQGDSQNKVASTSDPYGQRLAKMTDKLKNEDGLNLNFKVYMTRDVNANATADGSIRVYSGLMDMMDDAELFYIVGHEIGHVKNGDSLDAVRVKYTSSGLLKAADATVGASASAGGIRLSTSQLAGLLHEVINAQFSQSQEYEADAYGYRMMKKYGVDPNGAVTALQKIDKLGQSGGVLASHPNSADRAKRIADMMKTGKN